MVWSSILLPLTKRPPQCLHVTSLGQATNIRFVRCRITLEAFQANVARLLVPNSTCSLVLWLNTVLPKWPSLAHVIFWAVWDSRALRDPAKVSQTSFSDNLLQCFCSILGRDTGLQRKRILVPNCHGQSTQSNMCLCHIANISVIMVIVGELTMYDNDSWSQ